MSIASASSSPVQSRRIISPLPPGADSIEAGRLLPQCDVCLFSLDREMAAVWLTSFAGIAPEAYDLVIQQLLKLPKYADLATDDDPS